MRKYNIILQEPQATKFKEWLKKNYINYEPSAYGQGVYFNIRATQQQAETMNDTIKRLYN